MKYSPMWPFDDPILKNDVKNLKHVLEESFTNVKTDTSSIFQWITYLQQTNQLLQKKAEDTETVLADIMDKLDQLPASPEELKKLIDQHYQPSNIDSQIGTISSKIESWQVQNDQKQSEIFQKLEHLTSRVTQLEAQKSTSRASFKQRIIKKIQKSSKDYVKNLILNFIHKYEKISALKLREIVVEEQGLCSKSSFYRILEEIEETQDDLSVLHQGKEKIFMSKLLRKGQQS